MITELTKAVLEKHGPCNLTIDNTGRFGIRRNENEDYRYWSFSFINCLIRLLAEEKKL